MKNFLRVTMLAICAIFMVANVSAQVITAERASEIANQFFANGKQKSAAFRSTNATLTQSIDSRAVTGESNDAPTFHILTGANGKGFVIVSGEETENPIIGYSFDGTIDTNNLPDGFVDYMTDIDAQVRALREYNAANPQKAAARSAMQKAADFEYNANTMGNIVKNLNTAPWGQRTPFNNLCKTTDGQTALTGCGPTAFAILCYYHKWPASGVGTVTHQGTGENMELGRTYDYASMRNDNYPTGYTEEQANAVAVLMRDLGWACEVGYGTGSTSYGETSRHLTEHFYYKDIRTANSNSGATYRNDDEEWKRLIKESLDKEYPIPYSSTTGGTLRHIYILDGYTDNDYYHFNWGWSGQGNGWFTLDNMVPDDVSNYSNSHKAYFNLIPDATTYTVTATATPTNMGTVSINGGTAGSTVTANLMQGVTATLTAHPAQDYALANWTKGGVIVGTRNTLQVPVGTSGNDYVANFDDEANVYVTKDYTVNPTTGNLNNGTSKSSIWAFTTSNEYPAELTIKATDSNGSPVTSMTNKTSGTSGHILKSSDYIENTATASTAPTKYTLSVSGDYVITGYDIKYYPSNGSITVNNEFGHNETATNSQNDYFINVDGKNVKSTWFTIEGTGRMETLSFVVHIQSNSGSTPEPDPTPNTYTIYATAGVGGSVTINGDAVSQKSVNENSTVTLVATPQTGYRFVNWTSGTSPVSTDATYEFTATGTTSLVANFEQTQYTVTVAAGAGGSAYIDTKGTTEKAVSYNENVTITAEAASGYSFVKWTDSEGNDFSNQQSVPVSVTTDVTYTAVFEPVLPITGTEVNATFAGATGFVNGGYTNQVVLPATQTAPAITFSANAAKIGHSTVDGTKHPYLFKGTNFTISVPAPYKIAGYKLTVQGHNFNAGTFTYTVGTQNAAAAMRTAASARSNTATATISGTTPLSVVATGLNTSEINIGVESATAATAGIIVKELQLDLVQEAQEPEPEYTLGDRITSDQLMSITNPTHIAVKNLSKTNNWYFAGETNVEAFGNEAVFVWTPKEEGIAGEYYLKTLDGKYLGAAGDSDNTPISYTEDVANAAVFTTLKPVAGSTGTSKLDKDSDTGDYVDNDDLLVRFMTKYSGGTGDVTTWINVTHYTTPNHPKYYNGGYGMYTAHFVYAVSVDGVAPEIPGEQLPTDPLAGKYFRLKEKSTGTYMNIYDNATHSDGAKGGVNVTSLSESSDDQIFQFITSGTGYMLQSATGYYINCQAWNVDANSTTSGAVLTLESTANELEYLIHCEKGYFKIGAVDGNALIGKFVYCNEANNTNAATWVLEEVIPSNEKTLDVTFNNATYTKTDGTELTSGWGYQVVTQTTPAVTIKVAETINNFGYTTGVISGVKTPYLYKNTNFILSISEQYKITGYKITVRGQDNSYSGDFTCSVNGNETSKATLSGTTTQTLSATGLDTNIINISVGGTSGNGIFITALEITYIENEFEPLPFKAEIEGWRNDNPNTHLGTITIGGTAMKLTPEHLTTSELTMPLNEGSALAFTRKYRGFEFNGFYIGATSLGTNPTLTADNVDAIDENNPLIAKFTATDDVTLFYDDDEFSYRIPAIVKTVKDDKHKLIAISDYRHGFDDIGRDNHGTGTTQVDLVIRTSEDNGVTWTAKQTIAEGSQHFGYGDAAAVANGQNVLIMAVAGNVFYAYANSDNPQQAYRIYSNDNGATWEKEDISSNMESLFPDYYGLFFGSGKLVVDPDFNGTGNPRVYGAVLTRGANKNGNYVLYSDDWGKTWNILGNAVAANQNEPKVEILPNGQILLSARRDGGRTFNVFTYTDKANNAGTWSTATNGCDNGGNGTNGEIICLDAKRPNGMDTKILLQSQPFGSDRRNVSIWYKEISANETYTAAEIASGWTKGKQVSTQLSAYSAMCLQENGEIALFFEEAPCHNDDHTYGYSMVYVPLTIEEITNDNFLNPDADVEYVPTEFNIVLTDAQDNEYRETLDYIPADVAAVESYLTGKYSFITLGNKGAIADNTYTNSVTLPFKVSNADNAYWHNIYWPSYNPPSGKIGCPVYLSATVGEQYVPKVKADALYGASEYNTLDWADRLSWAVYSVNNSLTFKFKNKSAEKYIQVTSVASGSAQNTVYVDEGNATVFTLLKDTGTRIGDYALAAKVGETTGYLCSTSVGYDWATHFEHTNHEGAWVVFQEEEVVSSIQDLNIALNLFGEGALHVITDEVQGIITALESPNNIKLNTLDQYGTVLDNAMTNWKTLTLTVDENEGTVTINNETRKAKKAPSGFEFTVVATPKSGYRFVNWTDAGGDEVSTNATYTFNMPDAATELTANFEIEESQEGLTTGYYHIVSRVTTSHEYLYNNALRTNNSKKYTLQSDSKVTTNNGIWHITVNDTKLGVKNGDGNALVTGDAYRGAATSHETLTIEKTTVDNDVTYYSFIAGINCTNRGQYNFTLEGTNPVKATDNNYVTTWAGHPDDQANQWRLERIDTDGKNIYNVVVECTEQDVYVVYGSGTNEEYAFNGGFFITDATIKAQQLTAKKGNEDAQGVTVLVEGNTIRVVDTEYVEITVSASPAEGGTVTINGEATSTKQVVKSSNVTVEATPADGYHFVKWTDAGSNEVSTEASYTFTASESTSLVANFEADVVYHTITVSKYYANNGGTVKVGEEDATSVNVAEGESVRMLATVANGYEFMGWLKDGVIVKNAINGGLDFEVQGPDYTLYNITAPAEYVAVFSKITETTGLEDGKAYRICGVQGNGRARCIYRDGNTLKWKYDYDNNDVNTIFVAQKNGNAINLISAVGYHGWKANNMLGNDEQYNPYAAIKVTYGTRDELRTLYLESGTSNGLFQTNTDGAFSFQNSRGGGLTMIATDEATTDFLFEEVDTYAFQVSAADGSNAKLGTVNLPFATTVPAEVTVYGVNNSNEDYVYVAPLELTDNVLPANTPVLIEAAEARSYGFKPAPASANVYETGFAGTLEAEAISGTINAYILSYKGVGTPIKMYKLHSTDRTINANKAYFIDSTGRASALQFVFGGTTDIEEVEREDLEDTIYDLQGRKLSEITEPGIYIVNGKKVWIK